VRAVSDANWSSELWRTTVGATLRGGLAALVLGLTLGGPGWVFVGIGCAPLFFLERWALGRRPGVAATVWCASSALVLALIWVFAAFFQGIYLSELQASSPRVALSATVDAWHGLGEVNRPQAAWHRLFPWHASWTWRYSPLGPVVTGGLTAAFLAANTASRVALARVSAARQVRRGALLAVVLGVLGFVVSLTLDVLGGEIPREQMFTSLQGLDESLAWLGFASLWGFGLPLAHGLLEALERRLAPRDPAEPGSLPAGPGWRASALVLVLGLGGLYLALVVGPRALLPDALTETQRRLAHAKPSERLAALEDWTSLGARGRGALRAVLRALADPDPLVRGQAAHCLGIMQGVFNQARVREEGGEAIPGDATEAEVVAGLRALLEDPVPRVRHWGAWTLGVYGAASRSAVSRLITLMEGDPDPEVRAHALYALESIASKELRVQEAWRRTALSQPGLRRAAEAALLHADVAPPSSTSR
jgi:HEAT repeat protein